MAEKAKKGPLEQAAEGAVKGAREAFEGAVQGAQEALGGAVETAAEVAAQTAAHSNLTGIAVVVLAALVCLLAGGLAAWGPQTDWLHWLYPLAFFVLAIAHAGVRIGRKTYMVDMAGGTKRTDYTAVSNTVIGVLLLFAGAASAAVAVLGNDWALVVLGGMGAAGVVSALCLNDV